MVEEGGKPVIYVRLKKAIYGTLNASLILWKDITAELKGWGFAINPYDECVANKTVNGKQCTILWHVDDLKISHFDSKVVDSVLRKLGERYGKDAPLLTTRGKVNEYIGMTLDLSSKGEVMIKMYDYEDKIFDGAADDMEGYATSPAADHIYEVMLTKVDKKKYEKFVVEEGGKPVIYVRLKKVLHRTLNASLLFWMYLTADLKGWGFAINPYNECVANKTVNGKQCTILWHVGDLEIYHVNSKVVDSVLGKLGERYSKDAPLVTTRGKVNKYLRMTLDLSSKGEVMIKMYDYGDKIVNGAPDDMEGHATSPAE